MKKYFSFFLFLCFLFSGCSSKKALEGKWETTVLIKNSQEQKVFDSNIDFSSGDSFYEARGLAGVNLFDAFLNSDSYKLKKGVLCFYNQEKHLELRLEKK